MRTKLQDFTEKVYLQVNIIIKFNPRFKFDWFFGRSER